MHDTTETTPASTATPPTRLIPVTRWPEFHPWPTLAGLRHLAFHRAENGADAWIVMVGRRMLVDEAAFLAWAKAGQTTPEAATDAAKARRKAKPAPASTSRRRGGAR